MKFFATMSLVIFLMISAAAPALSSSLDCSVSKKGTTFSFKQEVQKISLGHIQLGDVLEVDSSLTDTMGVDTVIAKFDDIFVSVSQPHLNILTVSTYRLTENVRVPYFLAKNKLVQSEGIYSFMSEINLDGISTNPIELRCRLTE